MNQINTSSTSPSDCRSIFQKNSLTPEEYTKLWIQLINQIERGKQTLAAK